MQIKTHLIEIYEPYDYAGQNPLPVEAIGKINGPGKTEYYLLDTNLVLSSSPKPVNQLVINPRYQGDNIHKMMDSQTTVGISCLKQGIQVKAGDSVSYADLTYWGVGKIKPAG